MQNDDHEKSRSLWKDVLVSKNLISPQETES